MLDSQVMVTGEIIHIIPETPDDEEVYEIELSLAQYSKPFRSDPIPAEKYDKETAIKSMKSVASDLVDHDADISVKFPKPHDEI